MPTTRWHPLALVPLALTAWVYRSLIHVFFFADDFYHLAQIADGGGVRFVFTPFAGHNLVVRNLVFIGMWKLFGLHSEWWYATVLATHLLNVWLLFRVLGVLTGSASLACFGAAVWGICPLGVGTVGWYSVYGQVLVATVLLLVLDGVTRATEPGAAWAWYALLLVGTTCFGTGVAVAVAFPIVLFLLLPAAWARPGVRAAYLALPVVTFALYLGCRQLGGWFEPKPLQEALQQFAVLHGWSSALRMLPSLVKVGITGVTLGHASHGCPAWLVWTAVAGFALGLGLIAWRGNVGSRRAMVAMAVLTVVIYAVIAAGRAELYVMFSADLAEAAKAPRYHYLGTIPIAVLLSLILGHLSRERWIAAVPGPLALIAGLGVLVAGYELSGFRVDSHAATRAEFARMAAEIEQAVATVPPGAVVRIDNLQVTGAFGPWLEVAFPGRAAIFLLISTSDELDGRRVRFVEPKANVLDYWRAHAHGRLATLLEPPE